MGRPTNIHKDTLHPATDAYYVITRSMQGMFGASVSRELYLLIKSPIIIGHGRAVDLCVITQKKYTAYTGTVSQAWL